MLEAQSKIVSIATFRAARQRAHASEPEPRRLRDALRLPSPRNLAHRERMLRFLRLEAQEKQGRLLP